MLLHTPIKQELLATSIAEEDGESKNHEPIICKFENGCIRADQRENIKINCYQSAVSKSKKKLVCASTGSHNYFGTFQKSQTLRYYVAVIDKKTGMVEKVSEAHYCNLKTKPPDNEDSLKKKEDTEDRSYSAKSDSLVEAFGTAKQKRALASRKKNEKVQSTITSKVVDVATSLEFEPSPTKNTKIDTSTNDILPKKNEDATSPSEVYNVHDIISENVLGYLRMHSRDIFQADEEQVKVWSSEAAYPEFILFLISKLPLNQSERAEKSCYIAYLHNLMILHQGGPRAIKLKVPLPSIKEPIKSALLQQYTVFDEDSRNANNRMMPIKHKDKLLCHILILSLIIADCELDFIALIRDLKLGALRLRKLLVAIGCSIKQSSIKRKRDSSEVPEASFLAALSMPLTSVEKMAVAETCEEPPKEIKQIKKEIFS